MFKFLLNEKSYGKPAYIHRIETLQHVRVIRLQGDLDQAVIPVIEERDSRNSNDQISYNVLLDFAKVGRIDSAMIAYHLVKAQEYQQAHHRFGFINLNSDQKAFLSIFNLQTKFVIYPSEEAAMKDLNRPS